MKVWRRPKDRAARYKLAVVGERIPTRQIPVWIAQGSAIALGGAVVVVECESDGKRFKVGRGIPLVSRYAAVKNSCTGANGGLAIAKRVPCQAKTRRNIAPGNGDNSTSECSVS